MKKFVTLGLVPLFICMTATMLAGDQGHIGRDRSGNDTVVDGALVRTLIGQDLPRAFQFSGNQLIVKSIHPEEHWRVVWERE